LKLEKKQTVLSQMTRNSTRSNTRFSIRTIGTPVMKGIAAPLIGGMVSSTVLTLLVIPVVYSIWRRLESRMLRE